MQSTASRQPHGCDLPDPLLTENGRKVLEARYLKKDESGETVEQPVDLFRRVAATVAEVETRYGGDDATRRRWERRFYDIMARGEFMPNSPTLMNAGREMGMLSACFVLPVRDSIVDIFDSIKYTALIQKAGGGTGFAFDELRPTGDYISSSGGTTSGPITFWKAFSEATNAIQQGAFRRGANMGMMYVHHPDILKFLHAKQDLTQFTNYNISVKVTDAWMEDFLAEPDSPHVVRNPRNGQAFVIPADVDIWKSDIRNLTPIDCVEPVNPNGREKYFTSPRLSGELPEALRGKVYTKRQIWNIIIQNAWQTGEPGVVFIDRINEHNPTPHVGRMESTNPCGEQPLLPFEACNLGSINLGKFITNPCTPEADVDWEALRESVHASTRFLDNVIDANNYPLPEIDAICKANRKIGLGIMGFADALYMLGVRYNSDDGVAWGERFMKFVNDETHQCSEALARDRGCFPNWAGSIWQTKHHRLMRNACSTTVAPTGTISIIANCSGGIEPMFSLAFIRNVLKGQKQGEKPLVEVNETFRNVAAARGFLSDELLERIAREGTLVHLPTLEADLEDAPQQSRARKEAGLNADTPSFANESGRGRPGYIAIPADVKRVFVCAHDITPEWHMKMQAAFQRHCDSSISKTINFAHAATAEQVEEIYRLAFEMRCKGVTVYRDGCRECQPMALKKEEGTEARRHEGTKGESGERRGVASDGEYRRPAGADVNRDGETERRRDEVLAPAASPGNGAGNGKTSQSEREAPASAAPRDVRLSEAAPAARRLSPPESKIQNPQSKIAQRPLQPRDLPAILSGLRIRQLTPFGNMHVKITVDPRTETELEVFAQLGKGGDVATSDLEAICRMISLWLRAGGPLILVIKQLEGIGSSLQIPTRTGRIVSLGDGLASALKMYMRAKERFGLRSLLLGEIDPAEIDNPLPPPHHRPALDRPAARATNGGNGNGHGNGEVVRTPDASRGHDPGDRYNPHNTHNTHDRNDSNETPSEPEAQAEAPRDASRGHGNDHDRELAALLAHDAGPDAQFELQTSDFGLQSSLAAAAAVAVHDPAGGYKLHCPECGNQLARQEGCAKCHACGWAQC